MIAYLSVLGRFHPLVLHLPIGILLLAFTMEVARRFFGKTAFQSAIAFSLRLALVSSFFSVITGYLLAQEGGYEATLLWRHQYLGFGVFALNAILVALLPRVAKTGTLSWLYFPFFCGLILALLLTGHHGGALTHGANFLTAGFKAEPMEHQAITEKSNYYEGVVHEIFKTHCLSCHNANKIKGGLRLDTPAFVRKGSDSGSILPHAKTKESKLLEVLSLPLQAELHMPPQGKKQLTKAEQQLLRLWLDQGASFEQAVGSYAFSEEQQRYLKTWEDQRIALNQKPSLKPVKAQVLQKIREQGIDIHPIAYGQPYLEASYAYRDSLDVFPLQALQAVKKHLRVLKLHSSPIEDQHLKKIASFSLLQRVDLHDTKITDQSLRYLSALKQLQYLNLYQTQVSDDGIKMLEQQKELQELFLWQTQVTLKGAKALEEKLAGLQCNLGRSELIFGKSKIKPPQIKARSSLIRDSLSIVLSPSIPGGILRYTLDGSAPDNLSPIYTDTLILASTKKVKVICEKENWESSEVVEREFLKPDHLIENLRLSQEPAEKYPGRGDSSLYDLVSAFPFTGSTGWLGFQGKNIDFLIDLGAVQEVEEIAVGTFTNVLAWVFPLRKITCRTSLDGQQFSAPSRQGFPEAEAGSPLSIDYLRLNITPRKARYLKVSLQSQMKNPAWHASPGEASWLFVDEVLVW